MQRLTGSDAQHLYGETPAQHGHTCKIAVVDVAHDPDGYTFEKVKEALADRAHVLPPFRWRLVPVPGGVFHPLWADIGDLPLDDQVRSVRVAAPGGRRELCEVVSRIASEPLDRSKPLWELWVVEGMADGRVGFVTKMHHAIADGVASAQLLLDAMHEDPEEAVEPPAEPLRPDPVPTKGGILEDALVDLFRLLPRFPDVLRRTASAAAVAVRRRLSPGPTTVRPFTGPMTRFNRPLTPNRIYACTTLPLADVRAVKDRLDCTLNDVVLAMAGGALRAWLDGTGELPRQSLTAAVPVSVRRPEEQRAWGNRVRNMFTTLATDEADPLERVRRIHDATTAAKAMHADTDPRLQYDWWEFYPLWKAYISWTRGLVQRITGRPSYNLIISNVRGPGAPLFVEGFPLEELHSMGPLANELGLNITMWSYCDQLSFGVVACPEHVPDLWDLVDRLPDALRELRAAVGLDAPPELEHVPVLG
jgi:diacylglycerol O-acyltransferase / wax synthase